MSVLNERIQRPDATPLEPRQYTHITKQETEHGEKLVITTDNTPPEPLELTREDFSLEKQLAAGIPLNQVRLSPTNKLKFADDVLNYLQSLPDFVTPSVPVSENTSVNVSRETPND